MNIEIISYAENWQQYILEVSDSFYKWLTPASEAWRTYNIAVRSFMNL
jgi:hypothetical protein